MKERPILFSAPMVRAILDGRKTQTRRVIKPQPSLTPEMDTDAGIAKFYDVDECIGSIRCPYGVPGDRLWVRETLGVVSNWGTVQYAADDAYLYDPDMRKVGFPNADACEALVARWGDDYNANDYKLVPSIFMPRWASRILLEVTDVRVQRVQEISVQDAMAEGIPQTSGEALQLGLLSPEEVGHEWDNRTTVENFAALWNRIHGPGAWERNEWVWAVTFKPIDARRAA